MKILILVWLIIYPSGNKEYNNMIIDYPEEASYKIYHRYKRNMNNTEYRLYEVSLPDKTIKEIAIPKVTFTN